VTEQPEAEFKIFHAPLLFIVVRGDEWDWEKLIFRFEFEFLDVSDVS
jgi:hypothetical protein